MEPVGRPARPRCRLAARSSAFLVYGEAFFWLVFECGAAKLCDSQPPQQHKCLSYVRNLDRRVSCEARVTLLESAHRGSRVPAKSA